MLSINTELVNSSSGKQKFENEVFGVINSPKALENQSFTKKKVYEDVKIIRKHSMMGTDNGNLGFFK